MERYQKIGIVAIEFLGTRIDYTKDGMTNYVSPTADLFECPKCGALVVNPKFHEESHVDEFLRSL